MPSNHIAGDMYLRPMGGAWEPLPAAVVYACPGNGGARDLSGPEQHQDIDEPAKVDIRSSLGSQWLLV